MSVAMLKASTRMACHRHRVLIYTTCYNVLDGVTFTIRKLENELLAAGHYVFILTTKSGNDANTYLVPSHPNRQVVFIDNAFTIPFLHDPNRPEQSYQMGFALSPLLKQKINDFEPSIMHITVTDCTSLHLIQYARTKEIPLMGTFHSNIPEYMDHYPGLSWLKHILAAFFHHQYNFMQALYVPTPYIRQHLIHNYNLDNSTSLNVWGRGVDVEQFNPRHRCKQFRQRMGIDETVCVVLWVGRLVPEKRPDVFAKVVRRLHKRGLNFHALVVGAGPCEKDIIDLPKTTFAEWMNADQLAVAYASSDVFLFPSAVETFGNVTLEAAASGLPVVVESFCSGHLVNEGQNGFLVNAEDDEKFFEATLALVADRKLRIKFGEASRKMALSLEKTLVVRQMLENYSRVTDEFYTEYGGHHSNRDNIQNKPGSFSFGHYPRPIMINLVEFVFILIFRIMWNFTSLFTWVVKSRSVINSQLGNKTALNSSYVIDKRIVAPKQIMNDDIKSCTSADSTDNESVDDATETVLSDDNDESSSSTLNIVTSHHSSLGHKTKEVEWYLSHALAKSSVKCVQMQSRFESYVRDVLGNRATRPTRNSNGKRKSSFALPSSVPSDSRRRSSETMTMLAPVLNGSNSPITTADKRIVRRSQGTQSVLFV